MYLEHFWLSVIGIFLSGALSMIGIILAVDAHKKARAPRVPLTRVYDPRNPINARGMLNWQYEQTDDTWYEVRPTEWW